MCSYFSEGGDLADIVRAIGFRDSSAQCQITPEEATRLSTEEHGNYTSNLTGRTLPKDSEFSGLVKDLLNNDKEAAEIRPPDIFSRVLQISTDENKPQLQVPIGVKPNAGSAGSLTDQEVVHIFSPHVLGTKRRKTLAKKVVLIAAPAAAGGQPGGEVVPTDLWAWRKYGQKPIKGSPYPRGYYRCSSSKGCSARKQVERSLTDPNMLVITYTSDHNHPWPIQRNSLAGSTRVRPVKGRSVATESSPTEEKPPSPPDLVSFTSLKDEELDMNKEGLDKNTKVLTNTSSKSDDFFTDLGDLDALDPFDLVFSFKAQRAVEMEKNDA